MENFMPVLRARTMPLGTIMNYMEKYFCFSANCTLLVRENAQKHLFSSLVEIQVNLFDLVKLRRNLCELPRDLYLCRTRLIL